MLIVLILHDSPVPIALDTPDPKLSYAINAKDRDSRQAYHDERDGDGGGPENPLFRVHVTYVVSVHTEK